jgi:hypothetical protein
MNLLSGKDIASSLKLKCQPKIIFVSSAAASASNLFFAGMSWRGMGSFSMRGLAAVLRARRTAFSILVILLHSPPQT